MRLATRLTAVTATTLLLAASAAGALLIEQERRQLLADERAELRVLTRSIQASAENALRDGQEPDIAELLQRLELIAGRVDVMVFDRVATAPRQASEGSLPMDDAVQQARRRVLDRGGAVERLIDEGEVRRLVLAVPLNGESGGQIGALVLSHPLHEVDDDLRSTSLLVLLAVLGFASVTGAVLVLLLRREVASPLAQLARATRALGEDLDVSLDLPDPSSDELRALCAQLLTLQGQLREARAASAREAERRESLERQLREADRLVVVGQLAAGVAHEIGSPLQVLVGRARLLAADEAQTDEARRQAELIGEQAARISAIVGRLQDVVRRRPSRRLEVDLAALAERVGWLLEAEARARGVRLTRPSADEAVPILADPDEVQQVVLNLVLNALQACRDGDHVRVEAAATPTQGVLRVLDDGPGVAAEVRERLFEPFATTRAEQGGTGLGLSVVRSIVERHRASIDVQTEAGEGSLFEVRWPRAGPDHGAARETDP